MKTDEVLLSLIYVVNKKQVVHSETSPFYLIAEEDKIINARDILSRDYDWNKTPKSLTPYNDVYLIGRVLVDKPKFNNDESTLGDLEYCLRFIASDYEFPGNVNAIAEELWLPIFEGRIE
tara:strand:- start:289 stop:648 length:360 start_codon:yes stop_codon:yes gene_type:complete